MEVKQLRVVDILGILETIVFPNCAFWYCVFRKVDVSMAETVRILCKQRTSSRWEIQAMIFESRVVQIMLHDIGLWCKSIAFSTWGDGEIKKNFGRHLGIRHLTWYSGMLLEVGLRTVEILSYDLFILIGQFQWKVIWHEVVYWVLKLMTRNSIIVFA